MALIVCTVCPRWFAGRPDKKYCSVSCRERAKALRKGLTCAECGKGMVTSRSTRPQGEATCRTCQTRHGKVSRYRKGCRCDLCRVAKNLDMKLSGYNGWISPRRRLEIYLRDGWVCGICSEPVDPELSAPARRSASLDHIIPRSHGGSDESGNLRLAHRKCNSDRGAPSDSKLWV